VLEIFGLVAALGTIASFARGRGASPVKTVGAALLGFLLIILIGSLLTSSYEAQLAVHLCAWGWVGAIALFVRFVVGRGRPSPIFGSWICKNCSYTNGKHAQICEACEQPWRPAY
jgi:hypothetical protein